MKNIGNVATHIPAIRGWFVIEPVGTGVYRLPVAGLVRTPVIAWLIDTSIMESDDSSISRDTQVFPITPDGNPTGCFALQAPDKTVSVPGDQELFDDSDVVNYFTHQIEIELRRYK